MCDAPDPAVWSCKWVRARVPHACTGCASKASEYAIQPGDLYWSFSGLWDGSWGHGSHCGRCHAIFEFLVDLNYPDPVDLALDCGETLGDPEDPAHALAFWTRTDGQNFAEWRKDQEDIKRRVQRDELAEYHRGRESQHPTEEHHAI